MSKRVFKSWRYALSLAYQKSGHKGFTLMELLIAAIISSLVVSGLLFLVVELLRIDNRETALEEVQRDTKRALNYIADDLREAVYVYEDPTDVVSSTAVDLPGSHIPILAFWKVRPIDESKIPTVCSTAFSSSSEKENECNILKIRRASYDLIIYSQIAGATAPWEGQSRISRFELKQYSNVSALAKTLGYQEPDNDFQNWQKDTDGAVPNTSTILVDYIGATDIDSTNPVDCQSLTGSAGYVRSPANVTEDSSFFACIGLPTDAGGASVTNQDVFLFLKGDVSARSSFVNPASDASRSPRLQTQVLIRGIINKNPTD